MKAFTNGTDTYIAEDVKDIVRVIEDHVGDYSEAMELFDDADDWAEMPDGAKLSIDFEDNAEWERNIQSGAQRDSLAR